MLKITSKYANQLKDLFIDTIHDEKYKYFHAGFTEESDLETSMSTWNSHKFVSVDENDNVIGLIDYKINRNAYYAFGLRIINFTDSNKITFGRDVHQAIDEIFNKYNFNKLKFGVFIGNPVEPTYDKLIKKYGGRIVGVQKEDSRLIDGKLYDYKLYEITKKEYFK